MSVPGLIQDGPVIAHRVDEEKTRMIIMAGRLLTEFNIEIAGGFGPLTGKVWRIGLMGFNSRKENVVLLLEAMRELL